MNYELAKELKDAGFPKYIFVCDNNCPIVFRKGEHKHFEQVPTLSELIEACGNKFHYLSDTSGFHDLDGVPQKWVAHSRDHCRMGLGSTPEEAVARLWLALNSKKP